MPSPHVGVDTYLEALILIGQGFEVGLDQMIYLTKYLYLANEKLKTTD